MKLRNFIIGCGLSVAVISFGLSACSNPLTRQLDTCMKLSNSIVGYGLISAVIRPVLSAYSNNLTRQLEPEDIEWVTNIIRYDSCKFSSSSGAQAILTVKEHNVDNNCGFIMMNLRGGHHPPKYPESAYVTFNVADRHDSMEGLFLIRVSEAQEGSAETPDVIAYLGRRYLFFPGETGAKLEMRDYTYSDSLFKECFILDSDNSFILDARRYDKDREVKKVVFSKEYGLIYYSFSDGEEFFRVFEQTL